jgi:hypothetical protein
MANSRILTWSTYYARQREDEGIVQSFFLSDLGSLAVKTRSHLNNTANFTETITGRSFGNAILIPGSTAGNMQLLHHGFSCLTDEEYSIVFVQGNMSDSSYFKILDRTLAVEEIRSAVARRASAQQTNCPSLESMLATRTENAFAELPAAGNGILRGHPNHLLINGDIFLMASGAPTVRAKTLAMKVINFLRVIGHDEGSDEDDETDDEEMIAIKKEASNGAESLLAMLWASENGGLTPIQLQDVPDNGTLNQIIRNVKSKLTPGGLGGTGPVIAEETGARGGTEAAAWAVSSQSIVQELNRMHESREADRAQKESNTSLLKTLNPSQKQLFTDLCKPDFVSDPVMSPFMTALVSTSSPQKAIGVLKVESGDWEGTFSDGCCHRFLSNGFLSLEASRGIPGGFTVFMFHPKTIDMGGKAFDTHTATLREYFDMDVEDATIAYYAKQGFFHPTNPHDLRIQLESAMDMLELLTCTNSIATHGLHYILNPKMWRRYSTRMHDRFLADKSFGSQFLYTIDLSLQTFFDRMVRGEECGSFLVDRATELMEKLQSGSTLGIQLPTVLLARKDAEAPAAKRAKTGSTLPREDTQAKKSYRHGTEEHVNDHPYRTWLPPQGIDFLDLFHDRSPGKVNWPKIVDTRLPKKKKVHRPAQLCARFQMTTRCTYGCPLAHVFARDLSDSQFKQADICFKEALAKKAP